MEERSITTYYETDHDRLDDLFKNYQYFKRLDHARAKEYFYQFKSGLERHIIWEEEILFPLFEMKIGLAGNGPTEMMRIEHRHIGEHLEAIHQKVKALNLNTDEEEQLLLYALSMHNIKEERILYPAIDRSIDEQERKNIFTAMESMPPERFNLRYLAKR